MNLVVVTAARGRHAHLAAQHEWLARGRVLPDHVIVVSLGDEEIARVVEGGPMRDRAVVVAEVGDRRDAVATALRLAGEVPGSTVLVAGKGHETGQEVAGTVHPFDDRTVLADLLATEGVAR